MSAGNELLRRIGGGPQQQRIGGRGIQLEKGLHQSTRSNGGNHHRISGLLLFETQLQTGTQGRFVLEVDIAAET
jgi:hypothetical protein